MMKIGKVLEVFLPAEEELTKIGFKILIEKEIITLIEKQNKNNVKIYKDDFVYIKKDESNNEKKYNIELITDIDLGDFYE